MGKLGLSQCLTPTGEPYVANRGGPLVGEELLLLQGIPADDLLLTRETEKQLRDLAGNAMSTTVVGACSIAAIVLGVNALAKGRNEDKYKNMAETKNLVRAPIIRHDSTQLSSVSLTFELGEYEDKQLALKEISHSDLSKCEKSLDRVSSFQNHENVKLTKLSQPRESRRVPPTTPARCRTPIPSGTLPHFA